MSVGDLRARVTVDSVVVLGVLAGLALPLAGPRGALGVVAAGALTVLNFWWLIGSVARVVAGGRRPALAWASGGARLMTLALAFVLLFAARAVEPLAVIAGLGVLPAVLIVRGLGAAHGEAQ
jgi:ATP synthase I chain